MYFILRLTQLIVRLDSRLGVLRYKIAPKCLLPGPFGHSGVGGNPGVERTVRSYNLVFTYPCQRPGPEVFDKWQIAPQGDIAHIITMPNVTRSIVDELVDDCLASARKGG